MWLRPEQLPHFVREARIESFSHFRPVASDSRPMRPGRSAFAARRSSSMRAFRSSGGNCGGRDARLRASRSRPDPFRFLLQKIQSPFLRHPAGERKPHGARGAHRNRNAAGAHGLREGHLAQPGMHIEGGHRISTALIAIPCITTAESVRSNLIFSNRIRQRSSR